MFLKNTSLVLGLIIAATSLSAQPFFNLDVTVPVTENSTQLKNPWAGGHNCAQVSTIDLNLDGIEDLLVFDKVGNKPTTYLNNGTANTVDYEFTPAYRQYFSFAHDWVLLRDYNCDGKKDAFAYNDGSISIYKNTSDPTYGVQFTKVVQDLKSLYDTNLITLFIIPVDIPTIADIDNDGDLDILTFNVGGTFLEWHKNMSMENYGTCDSLEYVLAEECWGHFEEDANSFLVTLGTSCKRDNINSLPPTHVDISGLHTGSCSMGFDNDGDGDFDVLISDISFKSMNLLTNGGDVNNANMIAQDVTFPSYDTPIDANLFPAAFYEDMNNDGKRDLVASPSRPNISENFNSVWYYENKGTDDAPIFEHQQKNFLQDGMIEVGEGAYPTFYDVDNDGLIDLLIGNYGYFASSGTYPSKVAYYRNTGTSTSPAFKLVTRDFTNLSTTGLKAMSVTFGDIDDDDVDEMIVGDFDGKLHMYENSASPGQPANFSLQSPNYQSIDIGANATPQLFDVDGDGLLDLLIGEKDGNINYYRNTGSAVAASFTLITNSFGGVDVRLPGTTLGYAAPQMIKYNGELRLLVGSEAGNMFMYTNIENNLSGNFTLVSNKYLGIWEGIRSIIAATDIDNDGLTDIVIGNYTGGVTFFKGGNTFNPPIGIVERPTGLDLNLYPNPANATLNIGYKGKKLSIDVYDLAGTKVLSTQLSSAGVSSISTAELAEGFYILHATNGVNAVSKKFVVMH